MAPRARHQPPVLPLHDFRVLVPDPRPTVTTTLSDLQTQLARQLHDTSNTTWSVAELTDLINQGIDALADFYPKEIVQTVGTVSAGVTSYAASSFENIYRVAIYTSAGSYRYDLPGGL